ncbi:spore germination protein KA [Seinonella peptonophila]|uniref:Spore germination protein KA n=1 Tax=Seinonella peptonophila TaxID=112248 RepID=A0A1M4XK58_9BACL|nr:spore germination protein [Seinonella peptonophila]SHE93748.1 spore germination protein KA [Seinonella peptonophila]
MRLEERINEIKENLSNSIDIEQRMLHCKGQVAALLYLKTLCDEQKIVREIITPLQRLERGSPVHVVRSVNILVKQDVEQVIKQLLQGWVLLLLENEKNNYLFAALKEEAREAVEPENERIVRGPHQGFTENILKNLSLIRRQIQSKHLHLSTFYLGKDTHTQVVVAYMKNLANPILIKKVKKRITSIKVDQLLPGYLEEFIEESPASPFPQLLNTERTDRVIANLMEGRVAIFIDGDPSVLIAPVSLFTFYQSTDDYHSRWQVSSFLRIIRLISFFLAFQLPAIYIAMVSFHPEMLPLNLTYNIQGSLRQIPFHPLIEAAIMELTLELIREAGIRLPSRVGQTIGIVGGLVIGDAVVNAGYISYTMIIIVAITAIASFIVPTQEMSNAVRLLRFPMMFAAAVLGLVGITFGTMILVIHLCRLESFGLPYFEPFSPLRLKEWKDAVFRFPVWSLKERSNQPEPLRKKQVESSRRWGHDQSE